MTECVDASALGQFLRDRRPYIAITVCKTLNVATRARESGSLAKQAALLAVPQEVHCQSRGADAGSDAW